jgi:type II secretory pathway pseudopilin PulG
VGKISRRDVACNVSGKQATQYTSEWLKPIKKQQGITYIEIMAVVTILSIVAIVAMPNLASNDHRKLDLAAEEVAQAIRFARVESMRLTRPRPESKCIDGQHGVKFDSNNNIIKVYLLKCSGFSPLLFRTPTFDDVYHPVDKKHYILNLKTDNTTAGVELQSYSIYFGSSGTNSQILGFNGDGNPKFSKWSADTMLNGTATITLSYLGQTRVISVAPMTGRVTVQ